MQGKQKIYTWKIKEKNKWALTREGRFKQGVKGAEGL